MIEKKKQLVQLGQTLACIGIERETARRALEALVTEGAAYSSTEMLQAVQRMQLIEARWTKAEAEYLTLRRELAQQ